MRQPDKKGIGDIEIWRLSNEKIDDKKAGICQFMVKGSFHPLWKWHYIYLVHLRDVEGLPLAKKHYIDAQYEIGIWAIKSDEEKEVDIDKMEEGKGEGKGRLLSPQNLAKQFNCVNDAQALMVLENFVDMMVKGLLSPDTDYRSSQESIIDHYAEFVKEKGTIN